MTDTTYHARCAITWGREKNYNYTRRSECIPFDLQCIYFTCDFIYCDCDESVYNLKLCQLPWCHMGCPVNSQTDLGHVNFEMVCERVFLSISFAALVALERLLPSVGPHVGLQMT